jgi:hypothetical protein
MNVEGVDKLTGAMAGTLSVVAGAPVQGAVAGAGQAVDLKDDDPFARHLERARENITTLAEKVVAGHLLLPLLKQVRNDPMKSDLFHGGFAEDVFGAELDQKTADRLAAAEHMPITRMFADRFFKWIENNPQKVVETSRMRMDIFG